MKKPLYFLLLCLLVFGSAQAQQSSQAETRLFAWVDKINIRLHPNLDALTLGQLYEGQEVLWQGKRSDHLTQVQLRGKSYKDHWYQIRVGKLSGWVHAATLQEQAPQFPPKELWGKKAEWFDSHADRLKWWNGLSQAWKEAFWAVYWETEDPDQFQQPKPEMLERLFNERQLSLPSSPPCEAVSYEKDLLDLSGVHNLTRLTYLEIQETSIPSLKGIGNLQNLESLHLISVNLSSGWEELPLLPKLETLDLSNNSLEDLEILPPVSSVQYLNLEANELYSLKGIEKWSQIYQLNVSGNHLKDLTGLEKLVELRHLNIGSNQITTLDALVNMGQLSNLDATANQLISVEGLSQLNELEYLELAVNELSDLSPLKGKNQLKHLSIGDNALKDLNIFRSLGPITALTSLDISGSDFSSVKALQGLKSLEDLALFGLELDDFDELKHFPALKHIGWEQKGNYGVSQELAEEFGKLGIEFRPEFEGCGC